MGKFLIHTEQIAYFACADADVSCGNILVRTDVAVQFSHESLAETHYLSVATASYREVRATLAAAHRQCGKRVLECLFKAEELQD